MAIIVVAKVVSFQHIISINVLEMFSFFIQVFKIWNVLHTLVHLSSHAPQFACSGTAWGEWLPSWLALP